MEIHEAANIFPLDEEHLDELAADIKAHGQRVPVELLDGKVIDGRRRLRACERAGVEPLTRAVNPPDPVAYVLSLNLHRRHLSTSQRAMIAARAADVYATAAKDRQRLSEGRGRKGMAKTPDLLPGDYGGGTTRDTAGRAVGVAGTTVGQAQKVLQYGTPELVRAVDEGRLPVYTAAKLSDESHDRQREALGAGRSPATPKHQTERPALSDKEKRLRGLALAYAEDAINALRKIGRDCPGRKEAFQVVFNFMKANS